MGNYAQARSNYKKATHLNPDDSKLQYKVAVTYMLEKQWSSAVRHLEIAMRIQRNVPDYFLAIGECMLRLKRVKEAIQNIGNAVRLRPKKAASWEALIRCLIEEDMVEDAAEQCLIAMEKTINKPIFVFYYSASLLMMGKTKEALLQLERAMEIAPKLLKKFIEINPVILQNHQVVDVISRYKKGK